MIEVFKRTAVISEDQKYRYELTRDLVASPTKTLGIMGLNPSTADAEVDDNTIKKEMAFTLSFCCNRLRKVNFYGLRSTDPKGLIGHPDPVGEFNYAFVGKAMLGCDIFVVAWGVLKPGYPEVPKRLAMIQTMALEAGIPLYCFGRNGDGSPKHPLYLKGTTPLQPFNF